jgi:hypothetical protein
VAVLWPGWSVDEVVEGQTSVDLSLRSAFEISNIKSQIPVGRADLKFKIWNLIFEI